MKVNPIKNIMKRGVRCGILIMTMMLPVLSGCDSEAPYSTSSDVRIRTHILDTCASYIRVAACPSSSAYYALGAIPCSAALDGFDPIHKPQQFMTLMLDSLYREYMDWRFEYLKQGEEYIAPFSSHTLHYDSTQQYIDHLEYDTDYWLYAFPADPVNIKSTGQLTVTHFHTVKPKQHALHFDARIDGYFVMVYPHDSLGQVVDNTPPFFVECYDSLYIAEKMGGFTAGTMDAFGAVLYKGYLEYPYLYNVNHTTAKYSYDQDYWTVFEAGHTYYLLVGILDGMLVNRTVFRFMWTGPDYVNEHPEVYFREE